MKLTILGFMGGYPANGVGTSSYLLESAGFRLLIDAGSGSVLALEKHIDPLDLDAVILTHYHADHIADVGVLQHIFLLKNAPDVKEVPIYGHTESIWHTIRESKSSKAIDYSGQEAIEIGPFHVEFLKTIHPVVCYALAITKRETGKKFVFSADSGYMEQFIPFAKDADVFLADTNFFKEQQKSSVHMTSEEVGEIAEKAGVKKLILTHLPPNEDWQRLLSEAKEAAPNVKVMLAENDMKIII